MYCWCLCALKSEDRHILRDIPIYRSRGVPSFLYGRVIGSIHPSGTSAGSTHHTLRVCEEVAPHAHVLVNTQNH